MIKNNNFRLLLLIVLSMSTIAQAITGFVNNGGVNIFFQGEGTGTAEEPTIILVPGFPFDHTIFGCQLAALSSQFTVISIDPRGFGLSSKPATGQVVSNYSLAKFASDIHAVVVALGIQKPIIVGHDYSGLVGIVYANTYPSDIAQGALVLLASSPKFVTVPTGPNPFPFAQPASFYTNLMTLATTNFPLFVSTLAPYYLANDICGTSALQTFITNEININAGNGAVLAEVINQFAFSATSDQRGNLGSIAVPTLIALGQNDALTPRGASFFMRSGDVNYGSTDTYLPISDSEDYEAVGKGHVHFLTDATDFNAALVAFITGTDHDCNPCAVCPSCTICTTCDSEPV
jgi:pimeloyl-ACP methyl ester carboxylesterase